MMVAANFIELVHDAFVANIIPMLSLVDAQRLISTNKAISGIICVNMLRIKIASSFYKSPRKCPKYLIAKIQDHAK